MATAWGSASAADRGFENLWRSEQRSGGATVKVANGPEVVDILRPPRVVVLSELS